MHTACGTVLWLPAESLPCTGEHWGRESHILILDLASHQVTTLPGSDGKLGPHWSPDGQFISAASLDTSTLYVLDVKTQHWSALNTGLHAYALWSSDSRSIYFLRWAGDSAILRIPATGGEAKLVASLKDLPYTGTVGLWFGLDPTDTPLMLRDVSTTDVYALTLEAK
jgi:eukaryotic-like serine/threonine-protein kinase